MIWSLRTQLAFQQELCTQYEIDLGARDELVQGLTTRLDFTEKENEKRKNTLRSWKKKAVELEKMCRHLEDEVDTSRQETLERSIMDEATGEALRQLHSQISSLEREKEEVAAKESILRSERDALELAIKEQDKELVALRDHIKSRDASEFILKESLPNAQQQEEVVSLRDEVRALEDRIVTMEEDWNEGENKKHALEETLQKALEDRESLEQERDQLREQLHEERDHADGLTQALQDQEDRISQLDGELQFTKENVLRLEENLKIRDMEISSLSEKVLQSAAEAEESREQLSGLQREQARISDNQRRETENALTGEKEAREQLEEALKEKAKSDIMLGSCKERVKSLGEEVDRLRTQVHQLQQESADNEVKILQLTKQHLQDKEDINGLNIALDSKQQELELVKRRHGVRGTGGSISIPTPKPSSWREPSVPSTPRPSSSLSDVSKDGSERKTTGTPSMTPRPSLTALNRSTRANLGSTTGSKTSSTPMGPPASKVSRPSISATPTPPVRAQSALGKSVNSRSSIPGTPSTIGGLRRASVTGSDSQIRTPRRASVSSNSISTDEKENINSTPSAFKTPRRSALPA